MAAKNPAIGKAIEYLVLNPNPATIPIQIQIR